MSPMLLGDMLDEYPWLGRHVRAVFRHGFYLGFAAGVVSTLAYLWWLA